MKDKSTVNFPPMILFNLFVGFNELYNIKGTTKIIIKTKDNILPKLFCFFCSTFLPIGASSFSFDSLKAPKIELYIDSNLIH